MYAMYGILTGWLWPAVADVDILRDGRVLAGFSLEVADNTWRRARGLMGRTHLPDRGGMLFTYRRPRNVCIWMAGTPLHLDVLFVDDGGRIVKIAAGMEPGSAHQASSEVPVRWVVEVAAGSVGRSDIALGDSVRIGGAKPP